MTQTNTTLKDNQNKTYIKMTTTPVGPLILKMAIPTIISMMVSAIYNMADTFFVSQLGTSASGAVGIIFSLMALIQAFGFTIGMGSGSLMSRALGARDNDRANTFSSTAIFTAIFTGIAIAITGIIFQDWITKRLGATPTILPYAKAYGKYIFLAAPFMVSSFVMNNQLRFQGKASLSMVGLTTGAILNIFLDPLFIFVFKLGISGAAIATMCSQVVSFSILLSMFVRHKATTALSVRFVSHKFSTYKNIIRNGLPSLFRQGMGCIAAICLNVAAGKYGDAAVAGMSITTRVFMLLMSVAIGLGQGFQPVCAMNYGAKLYTRVRQAYRFLQRITGSVMFLFEIIVFIFAPEILRAFRDDPAVISAGTLAMRLQAIPLFLHSVIFSTNMLLQTTGKARSATFLSTLRQGLYFIPLILILPHFMGLKGVQSAQAISDLLTSLTSVPFAVYFFKHIGEDD